MEYVEGETLGARIGGRPLDSAEMVDIAVQTTDALSGVAAESRLSAVSGAVERVV